MQGRFARMFEDNKLATKLIEKLSDDDMAYFARRYGEILMDVGNWSDVAKEIFKSKFLEDDEIIERYLGKGHAGVKK